MKGISSVVAVILLLLITIFILGLALISLQKTTQSAATATESMSEATQSQMAYNFRIENFDYTSNILNLRNVGRARLENLGIYVDGEPVSATYSPISPTMMGDIMLDEPVEEGAHTIRITAGATEQSLTIDIPSLWFVELDAEGS